MVRENNSASPENVWKLPNSSSTEASSSNSPSPVAETQQEKQLDITSNRSQRKRPMTTGVWPCKIHGCNKQFAREADLKRHQRTTKMHSMPSLQVHFFNLAYMVPTFNSSCPQCDATFTRVMYNVRRSTIYLRFVRPMRCADTKSQGKRRHSTF